MKKFVRHTKNCGKNNYGFWYMFEKYRYFGKIQLKSMLKSYVFLQKSKILNTKYASAWLNFKIINKSYKIKRMQLANLFTN